MNTKRSYLTDAENAIFGNIIFVFEETMKLMNEENKIHVESRPEIARMVAVTVVLEAMKRAFGISNIDSYLS